MDNYKALVTDKDTGKQSIIMSEYPCLVDFKADLKANGYSIIYASTDKYFNTGIRVFYASKEHIDQYLFDHLYGY